jgi:hypothetical protein
LSHHSAGGGSVSTPPRRFKDDSYRIPAVCQGHYQGEPNEHTGRIGRRGQENWSPWPKELAGTPRHPDESTRRCRIPIKSHGCRVRVERNYGFVILSRRRWCRFGTATAVRGLQLPSRKSRFLGSDTEPRSKKRETQSVSPERVPKRHLDAGGGVTIPEFCGSGPPGEHLVID